MIQFNTIILSAGYSERMGIHKALLNFNNDISFLEQIVSTYHQIDSLNQIILVVNPNLFVEIKNLNINTNVLNKLNIIVNNNPEKDRFHSIFLACNSLKKMLPTFIQNIDNPFITKNDIKKILSEYKEDYYISPSYKKKGLHPILINPTILSEINDSTNYTATLKDFLLPHKKKYVEIENKNLLYNINTPEDYMQHFRFKLK